MIHSHSLTQTYAEWFTAFEHGGSCEQPVHSAKYYAEIDGQVDRHTDRDKHNQEIAEVGSAGKGGELRRRVGKWEKERLVGVTINKEEEGN